MKCRRPPPRATKNILSYLASLYHQVFIFFSYYLLFIYYDRSNSSKLGDGFLFNSAGEEDDGVSDDDDEDNNSNFCGDDDSNYDAGGANKSITDAGAAGAAGTKKGKQNVDLDNDSEHSFFAKASDDHDSAGGASRSGGSGSVGGSGHRRGRSAPNAGEILGDGGGVAASASDHDDDDRSGPWEDGSDDSSSDGMPRGEDAGVGRVESAKDLRLDVSLLARCCVVVLSPMGGAVEGEGGTKYILAGWSEIFYLTFDQCIVTMV